MENHQEPSLHASNYVYSPSTHLTGIIIVFIRRFVKKFSRISTKKQPPKSAVVFCPSDRFLTRKKGKGFPGARGIILAYLPLYFLWKDPAQSTGRSDYYPPASPNEGAVPWQIHTGPLPACPVHRQLRSCHPFLPTE